MLSAFLERTQSLLQSLAGGLQLELPQLFLDGGFTLALLFLRDPLLPQTLLRRPELFLDDALFGVAASLVRTPVFFDGLDTAALFG
ncbi:MAG: hypothetical protein JOZ73_10140 [Solirubrobacterales bacterium]|nr:hypothetical protein [Solirubrobacterales bacterium]